MKSFLLLLLLATVLSLSQAYIRPLMSSTPTTKKQQATGVERRDLLTKGFLGGAAAAFAGTFTLTTGPQKVWTSLSLFLSVLCTRVCVACLL